MSPARLPVDDTPLRLRLAMAWAALTWERLAAGLWPVLTVILLGVAVALTDALPSLPSGVHLSLLLVFFAAIAGLAWRGLRHFTWPKRAEARARLEAISPVSHRPLTAVEDTLPVGGTPLQRALWVRHQALARAALNRLRSPWPMPEVARRDGFAIRVLVVLLLAIAIVGAGRDSPHRLARAIAPALGGNSAPVTVKLWITPPAYTNRSPIYVESPAQQKDIAKLEIPFGSKALVMVSGARGKTSLSLTSADRMTVNMPMTPVPTADTTVTNENASRLEVQLPETQRIEVRQGSRLLGGWDVTWIGDQVPSIAFANQPRDGGRGRLRIDYTAQDDYGLQAVTGKLTRADAEGAIDIALTMPPFGPKQANQTSHHDLGGHPWAGMKVMLTLTATDQAGQSTSTAPLEVTLPERSFNHPVAQEIARRRKDLMADPARAAVPARDAFARLMTNPNAFNGDRVVFLALSSARYRLSYDSAENALKGLPELLWQTAVRIEDGALGESEQRLEAAEKALREAMERNAGADEISKLLDELQRSFADYARAMADKMPDRNMQMGGLDKKGKMISPEDIAKTMEQLRELSKMGAQDAAKQMLANLQNMLQTMKNAAAGNGGESDDMKSAQEMMKEMRELTEKQSELLNETFDQVRQNALRNSQKNAKEGDPNAGEKAADKQQKLREQLSQLMSKMANMSGQTPGAMGDAEKSMKNAEQALKSGAMQRGAEAQGQALSKMESGMQEASEGMMQALAKKGMSGMMQMPGTQRRLEQMGGQRNGLDDGENVQVPKGPDTEGMAQRVRTILDEIRKRAADRTRPEAEQEYLRRLMKEF